MVARQRVITDCRIEGEANVTRLTREIAFAEARAYVGSRNVVRATAVFKLMERKGR